MSISKITSGLVVKGLPELEDELAEATSGIFPSGTPYKEVFVILTHWSTAPSADQQLFEAIESLEMVFREKYHFQCFRIILNATLASDLGEKKFAKDMRAVLDLVSSKDLVIFYYGGCSAKGKEGQLMVQSIYSDDVIPRLCLIKVLSICGFTVLPNNAILFLDCCYAANLGLGLNHEIISAFAPECYTGYSLLTRNIARLLNEQSSMAITVAHLHQKLVQKFGLAEPSEGRLLTSPVYRRSNLYRKVSLVMVPLIRPPRTLYTSLPPALPRRDRTLLEHEFPKILVIFHITSEERAPNGEDWTAEEWKVWLSDQIPPFLRVTDIMLEGVFKSSYTVLLISLPIAVCDLLLQERDGFHVVDVVKSNNLRLKDNDNTLVEGSESSVTLLGDEEESSDSLLGDDEDSSDSLPEDMEV